MRAERVHVSTITVTFQCLNEQPLFRGEVLRIVHVPYWNAKLGLLGGALQQLKQLIGILHYCIHV